jgi:8-oxo-dGTP pyrophosphatase MutT (NUDIX family)
MEQGTLLSAGPPDGARLTREGIAAALAATRSARPRADALLTPEGGFRPGRPLLPHPPTPAAVLVPLVEHPDGLTVLLTQRTAHLAHHPGQISFPGGRLEETDRDDAVRCALRETSEEIGMIPETIAVLGRLDDWITTTGFVITPVVGAVRPPLSLTLDAFEVAEAFEVPLDFLLDPANRGLGYREANGRRHPFWTIPWRDRTIWGATAGILVNLSEALAPHAR